MRLYLHYEAVQEQVHVEGRSEEGPLGQGRQYSTVQYSAVQCSTVQYSTVQYSTVQYSTVQYNTFMRDQSENLTRYSDVVMPPLPTSKASRSATRPTSPTQAYTRIVTCGS